MEWKGEIMEKTSQTMEKQWKKMGKMEKPWKNRPKPSEN
jgi:hypothetical protein